MVALPYPSPRKSTGGTGPTGPVYIRAVPRRLWINQFSHGEYHEIVNSTITGKDYFVALAQEAQPGVPAGALGLEYFIDPAGGPGFSGPGYGGTPGATRRGIIPFDKIPDDGSIMFELGAPGLGQAGGKGYAAGQSSITTSDYSIQIYAEGGLPGQGSQEMQRSLHLWAAQNGVTISDLGQNSWSPDVQPVGPSSPDGSGAGAPTDYDTNQYYTVYGGYGARPGDPMYACGDGGSPGSVVDDNQGSDGNFPGGGGGASGPSHPGGSGAAAVIRVAVVVLESINE